MLKITDLTDSLPLHPTKEANRQESIKRIVVHTTDWIISELELAKYDINPNHISSTGCPTITYHYTVRQNGEVNYCVPHKKVTWHAGPWNPNSLAVALVYKTDPEEEKYIVKNKHPSGKDLGLNTPTPDALKTLHNLLVYLCLKEAVQPTEIWGHRELKGTGWTLEKGSKSLRKTCPGMTVSLEDFRVKVAWSVQLFLKNKKFYEGKIDGLWGNKSKAAFVAWESSNERNTF